MKTKTRYAVVDLEATGTGANTVIIQVGIVIIEENQVVETYATDVNPHQALDEHIISLTGITDEQLAKAPTFSQVAGRIFKLLEGAVFVAHNVQFDANLLAEQLFMEGYDLKSPRVDTVELAQVCFPTLDKYGLISLCQELDIPLSAAHTAIEDAKATALLFLRILKKLRTLPRQTLFSLANFSNHLIYETGTIISQAAQEAREAIHPQLIDVEGILIQGAIQPSGHPELLPQAFDLARKKLRLDYRPQQEAFAKLVADSYDQTGVTAIEGQAGLGKTYGYLLPLLARAPERQLIVAVPTKVLQDQLLTGEGQNLAKTYGIRMTTFKSPKNYLDLAKFAKSLKNKDSNRLVNAYKMKLLVWLLETQTGDLDEIRQKQGIEGYFSRLGHCGRIDQQSPYAAGDFWERCRQKAQNSQVLVTNHAFLLASLKEKPNLLTNKVLVIDEAQRFFLAMESSSRQRLDITQTMLTISHLLTNERNLLNRRLLESLQRQLSQLVTNYYQDSSQGIAPQVLNGLRQDLSEYATNHLKDLRELLQKPYQDFWLETSRLHNRRQTDLVGSSLDFLNISHYLTPTTKTYLISATIAISSRVGLPDLMGIKTYETLSLDHSRADNQLVFIDQDMPDLEQEDDTAYRVALMERLKHLITLQIPLVVLFTAKQTLTEFSFSLDKQGIDHLAQGRHGEASQVKRRFDKGEHNLLLGIGAFWEGIDFSQQERLIILIPKLPFDNPKDKFIKKVNRYLTAQGKQPFYHYSLPLAGLRLKQALGRGTRTDQQRSAVILLDNRLLTKSYGKSLIKTLQEQTDVRIEKMTQILSEIQEFCYNEKD